MRPTSIGITLAATAGLAWGTMAVTAQYLFENYGFLSGDLTCARLLGAGIIMLAIAQCTSGSIFRLSNRKLWRDLVIYGVLLWIIQYAFFESIRFSNAGTAAVIVAISPAILIVYLHVFESRPITLRELSCALIAFAGVFLLGTKGEWDSLALTLPGLLWGLLSAGAGTAGTLFCRHLAKEIGPMKAVGWATVLAGSAMAMLYEPWSASAIWTPISATCYLYVIVVGTVVAFYCYLQSMRYIAASVSSLVACLEPVSGAVLSVVLLGVSYGVTETVGATMILSGIIWLSWPSNVDLR